MMKCKYAQKLLMRHAASDLNEQESSAISEHLANCSRCSADLEELRESARVFTAAAPPAMEPSPVLWARLEAAIMGDEKGLRQTSVSNRPFGRALMFGTAGAAALLAIVGYVSTIHEPLQPLSGGAPLITGPRQQKTVSVPHPPVQNKRTVNNQATTAVRDSTAPHRGEIGPAGLSLGRMANAANTIVRNPATARPKKIDSATSRERIAARNHINTHKSWFFSRPSSGDSANVRIKESLSSEMRTEPALYVGFKASEAADKASFGAVEAPSPAATPNPAVSADGTYTVAGDLALMRSFNTYNVNSLDNKNDAEESARTVEMVYMSSEAKARTVFSY